MSGDFKFVQKLASAPWLCDPEHVEFLHGIFLRYLDRAASGAPMDVEAVQRETGTQLNNTREVTVRDGVARIPVEGTIMRRASLFTAMSGGVSTEALMRDLNTAYHNPSVRSILFVFDTPGGEAAGIHELAAAIREKRDLGEKPIESYVDGYCASAGYWLASATERITADATASLGSIGVVATARNPNAASRGGDIEIVSSRSPKKRPNPATESGRDVLQGHVDDLADVFIRAVAANRDVSVETVEQEFGQGFVRVGQKAVDAGMADALGSEEEVTRRLIEERHAGARALRPAAVQTSREVAVEQQTTQATEDPREEVGTVRRFMNFLGGTASEVALQDAETQGRPGRESNPDAAHNHATSGAASPPDEEAGEPDGGAGEETEDDMDSGATAGTLADPTTEEASDVTEQNVTAGEVTREEFERVRAELAQEREKGAKSAAVIRESGIDAMLQREGAVRLENGARGVTPPAQRTAAKTLIAQMAAAGDEHDPIELSASGEATLRDTPGGHAVKALLTPWNPQELGERGTEEGEARAEGGAGDHALVMAELERQGLDQAHYGPVAASLIAAGKIRRDLPGPA